MANAHVDDNRKATLLAASNAGNGVPVELWADPTTHRLLATATLTGGSSIPVSGATTATAVAIVDGSGNQITSFGGGTQYTEGDTDTTITGTAMMWEDASDTLRAVSAAKPLPVDIQDSTVAVTQSGTWNITNISGTVSLPTGAATAAKQPALGTAGSASTDVITIQGIASMTAVKVDGSAVTQPVSGTITANLAAGTNNIGDVDVLSIAAGDNNIGNVDIVTVPTDPFGANADAASATGSISAKLRFIASTGIPITGTVTVGSHAVTNAGTFAVQDSTTQTNTGNAATSLGVMDDWDNAASDGASVSGDVAHDTADAGEPVKIGGKAVDLGANGTDVSANDRVNGYFTRSGQQLVLGGHQNIISKNLNITDADGAQTDAAIVTVSAGTAIVVTKASVMVDSATTATGGVAVRIGFGTANVPAADSNGIILAHPGISAGSGVVEGNGSGIIGIGASNEDLRVTCEDPAGGNIDIIITYFTVLIG